jgi:hypothetical protein
VLTAAASVSAAFVIRLTVISFVRPRVCTEMGGLER